MTIRPTVQHVQITIPPGKEDLAREFYVDLLGLVEIPKPEELQRRGGLWLDGGPVQVHIGTEEGVNHDRSKAHIGWMVDDLASVQRILEDAGHACTPDGGVPGKIRFKSRDPFGNAIEFMQLTEGSAT